MNPCISPYLIITRDALIDFQLSDFYIVVFLWQVKEKLPQWMVEFALGRLVGVKRGAGWMAWVQIPSAYSASMQDPRTRSGPTG